MVKAWTHWQANEPWRVAKSHHIGQRGHAMSLEEKPEVVRVRHVIGFAREDWGEGNWTARDIR